MKKTCTRRTFLKKAVAFSAGTFLTSSFGYMYARYIEPRQLDVVEQTITSPNIPESFHNVKILQFSDIHLGLSYNLPLLERLVEKMNILSPDIVLFTGDLIDIPNEYLHMKKVAPILKQVYAPLGKFSIFGNHDHGGYGTEMYKQIMHDSEFKLLVNEVVHIRLVDNSYIAIGGLDDILLGKPSYAHTLGQLSKDIFSIIMVHEPDVAQKVALYPVDLQLSGHSHGGQIQIPFYGPLITPPLSTLYREGMYEVGDSKMQLYVNRGLGTTRLPFRFLAKPEITLFTLKKGPITGNPS
ncbi:putative MPP superfamily phosphohydrolase [Bacillus fengqiuensis]|nr:putative MPP superfamily phosphohydrolase [Bacillus fengqiuensis]